MQGGEGDTKLRWLHLTDLHVGIKSEAQKTAIASLLGAVERAAGDRAFDLILLSGDLAYSGRTPEYELLESALLEPLRRMPVCAGAPIVAAPGNHDLDCDVGLPIAWSTIGTSRQESFFNLDEAGRKTRSQRAAAFEAYSRFLRQSGVHGVDPTIEPAHAYRISGRGQDFVVVSIVTAFFSDKEVADYKQCPAPVHSIRTLLQAVDPSITRLVLGHHPLNWFTAEAEKQFRSLLVEQNAVYFNGHDHQVSGTFSGRGLLGIGFGASYQQSLDAPAKPFYRNSFAICELDEFLHTQITSWDSENGQWRLEQNLPAEFADASDLLPGGFCLPLPFTRVSQNTGRPLAALAASVRVNVELGACVWLTTPSAKRWSELLERIGQLRGVTETFALPTQAGAAGHEQFRVRDRRGNFLVYAVSGAGDILSYEQLKSINTELDRQDYDGCVVATFGTLADEAGTLATQLASRKPITLLDRHELITRLNRATSRPFREALSLFDPAATQASLVVLEAEVGVLLQDRASNAWFSLANEKGASFAESDQLVVKLRKEQPSLRNARYRPIEHRVQEAGAPRELVPRFDRQTYLSACYAHFDDVKYAPLAALGFKFRSASLSEIYVEASADASGSSKNDQTIHRALSEFVESLDLPKPQRDQLESQLRSRYGIDRSAEVGAARQLYQRYNSVIVLGDPGSGKTCFVKHEILAYCKPPVTGGSWYGRHIPVYVPLAEAARLADSKTDLLEICEILSARRGIELPRREIVSSLEKGEIAFFFDGLDEVGFIDQRIHLMGEINALVRAYAHHGCRFVIASRPAAVRPIDIPAGLTYLHLKGLTEEEMRVLAGRVLTVRLSDGDEGELTGDERALIDKLLEDTRTNAGIGRIARNPLLLTLLVLIYASTGAVSAKRHLIYTQAIKTLVSVRGRDTREQQLSEADLRTRLGAMAVAIFSREISEIPKRTEVLRVLSKLLTVEGAHSVSESAGSAFLQEVAEATGLLLIYSADGEERNDLVTFMHYSFLEYYAAAGLLSRDYMNQVPTCASSPRWKDIVTLLFGMLSEHSDVTPLLRSMLTQVDSSEKVTRTRLLLCMDCAAECDVPPIATQQLLADEFYADLTHGAGRHSAKVRDQLARKLAHFVQGAAAKFEAALLLGLGSANPQVAATFADLIARLPAEIFLSRAVCDACERLSDSSDPTSSAAMLFAVESRPELRTARMIGLVQRSLKGSLAEKHAALRVVAVVPAYQEHCSALIAELLDDRNEFIAKTAARCMLGGHSGVVRWQQSGELQEKLLGRLGFAAEEDEFWVHGISLDRALLERLLDSERLADREMAARYISLIRDDAPFVHDALTRQLRRSPEPSIKAACLDSLRATPGVVDLLTLADTDLICSLLQAQQRNVRLAAIRLLGEMPDDEQVIRSLQEYFNGLRTGKSREEEITATAKALARHTSENQKLRRDVLKAVYAHLPSTPDSGYGDADQQAHLVALLTVAESVGEESDDLVARRLLAIGESFKAPENVRRHCIRVFGRLADASMANLEVFGRLLARNDIKLNEAVYAAVLSYLRQCRRRVESVRLVFPGLSTLRDRLLAAWTKETAAAPETIDSAAGRDIRDAIIELEELMAQYGEFSERAKPAAATRSPETA
jgi:hypothetical protein